MQTGADAAYQGFRSAALFLACGQAAYFDGRKGKIIGLYLNCLRGPAGDGNDVQVNSSGQHAAVLVVGMVAADLASSRCAVNLNFPIAI